MLDAVTNQPLEIGRGLAILLLAGGQVWDAQLEASASRQLLGEILVAVGPLRHRVRLQSVGQTHGRTDKTCETAGAVTGLNPRVSTGGV